MKTAEDAANAHLSWAEPYLKAVSSCPLCAGTEWRLKYRLGILQIYQCQDCNLMFLNPCLWPDEQKMIFSSPEFLKKVSGFFTDYHDDVSWTTPKTAVIHMQVLQAMETWLPQKGKLLDVGCGKGFFLIRAKRRGWTPIGLEPNFNAVKSLQEKHQIKVYENDFFQIPVQPDSLDAISLRDFLEHTPDPLLWMRRSWQLLEPGGLFIIVTPNHYSFLDSLAHFCFRLTLGKFTYALKKLYTIDHTLYLTQHTLAELYRRSGFEILQTLRVNTDLSRYTMSPAFRIISEVLLTISSLFGLQNRVIMIGRKVL